MIYWYSNKSLSYVKVKWLRGALILSTLIGLAIWYSNQTGYRAGIMQNLSELSVEAKWDLIQTIQPDTFSQAKLAQMLKDLNVRFPHIVMAQAILESGNFQSNIFRSNRNLFGMKQARARITTAKGTELNHAYYDNWRESVYDYAFFQSRYLNDLRTEQAYLQYLNNNYAEVEDYDKLILKVIDKYDLRKQF